MLKYLSRLFCKHCDLAFLRNIYGDEIRERGWKRSIWQCMSCGKIIYKSEPLTKKS